MQKCVKEKEMSSTQLFLLAYQTCQWWNALFIQADRFFSVLSSDHGGTPWDSGIGNSMFIADRMFLITALFHAIENLEKLNTELQRKGDTSLQAVLQAIEKVASLQDIKNLRDMNVHSLDYLMEEGRRQDNFHATVEKNGYIILTTAAWTHVHGDANE